MSLWDWVGTAFDWVAETVVPVFGGTAGAIASRFYVCGKYGEESKQCKRAKGLEEVSKDALTLLLAVIGLDAVLGMTDAALAGAGLSQEEIDRVHELGKDKKEPPKKVPCLAGSCIYDINHLNKLYCIRNFLPPFLTKFYYRVSYIAYKLHIIR